MKIGYARVSTRDQSLDMQVEALQNSGCEKIYQEKISGSTKDRPELAKLLEHLREGDTLIVWRLDRLGRSLKNIIDLVLDLSQKKVNIKGLTDGVDTGTTNGRLFLNFMASFAEYERELIKERTKAGLSAARTKGRMGGRPKGMKPEAIAKIKILRSLCQDTSKQPKEIYEPLGITRPSFYRYIKLLEKYSDKELDELVVR